MPGTEINETAKSREFREKAENKFVKDLNITKVPAASARVQNNPSSVTNTADTVRSIADLMTLVKGDAEKYMPKNKI